MTRTPVSSSSIASIGHEGETLEIEFTNGRIYRHDGVSRAHYEALVDAESVGRHYNAAIKGQFAHVVVGDADR